ncbi:hypothetical protein J32TS6_14230 [Virgibacillus pantothenticus]|nr:helix-turn-helix transcriptional regulator [Virgibacillus pantothenticus]MEB5451981.1 helix-turn-helix transcriptional regulator [Virgibacillus pantothenticus]MEB5460135.1 helix-turn-helix transcriptional regulator [Virgibacillus pantothenticus]MEB5464584.1 helix-turn-helix transcriptional regulator [Virgibacillus pantothenticus]GIP62868.1 hypothetical protein J32TS6_14230 [Virgibacillus pantothenticus]
MSSTKLGLHEMDESQLNPGILMFSKKGVIKIFHNKLKALRHKSNKTQKELAQELNIGQSTIAMYENGKRKPDTKTLKKIADFFNVTVDYLLDNEVNSQFTEEEELDIARELERTIEQLKANKGLKFDGEPMDEETLQYIRFSLEKSIRLAKEITNNKFLKEKK